MVLPVYLHAAPNRHENPSLPGRTQLCWLWFIHTHENGFDQGIKIIVVFGWRGQLDRIAKHKVSFLEAKSVFLDENARVIADPDHSEYEERFLILGLSNQPRLLIVSHIYKEEDEIIRIISARKATRKESQNYIARLEK
jgi:uncharacterized DUF497 family protein